MKSQEMNIWLTYSFGSLNNSVINVSKMLADRFSWLWKSERNLHDISRESLKVIKILCKANRVLVDVWSVRINNNVFGVYKLLETFKLVISRSNFKSLNVSCFYFEGYKILEVIKFLSLIAIKLKVETLTLSIEFKCYLIFSSFSEISSTSFSYKSEFWES